MGRKSKPKPKTEYYDTSNNTIRDLSKNELDEIIQNKNKYFHDALNGIFIDEEKKELNCKNKKYMIRIIEIYNTCRISLCVNYLNKHVMYMYIMDKQFTDDKMVLKVGYTYSLYKRNKSLCDDFKCELYLIGIKEINAEEDEQKFHDFMRQMKKEYIYPHTKTIINKKTNETKEVKKFELYILCDEVINEFYNYKVELHNTLLIEQEKTKQIEAQEKTKQEQEKTKQIEVEVQEKTKQEQEKTKQIEVQEKTKQIEIELQEKTKQIEFEIELKKLDLEMKKLEMKKN
jgi:hypothetical protein